MKRRDRDDPESAIQREVFRHLKERAMPGVFAFHVPNGGKRRASTQYGLQGLTAGVPDVILIRGGNAYALELKRAAGGKMSLPQVTVHAQMRAAGVEPYTAYGLDDALRWLERHGFIKPDVGAKAA
jgi:hypothetical protein